jgi:hypothetical protein
MRDIQSADEIGRLFDSVALPAIDVSRTVMQRIYERKNGGRMPKGRKLVIGMLLSALLLFAAGFAVIRVWDLKGSGGLSYQYQLLDSGDTLPEEFYRAEFDFLQPGEALAVMKTRGNPGNVIHLLPKPIRVYSIAELSSIVGSAFKSPSALPVGYAFSEGRLDYRFDDSHVGEMIEESKSSDKDYITKVLKPGKEIAHYDIVYKNPEDTITVAVFPDYPLKDIYAVNRDHKAVKIKVKNFEAMYAEHDGIGEITWLEDRGGSTAYYSVRAHPRKTYESMKDDLIKVCGSLK